MHQETTVSESNLSDLTGRRLSRRSAQPPQHSDAAALSRQHAGCSQPFSDVLGRSQLRSAATSSAPTLRISRRRILPEAVFGSSGSTSTRLGAL